MSVAGLRVMMAAALIGACTGCSRPVPEAGTEAASAEFVAPGTCTNSAPPSSFSCVQEAGWGKCNEPWMRRACDRSCGRCYEGASSCSQAPRGEAIPGRLRFEGAISAFPETFELDYGNPNHPDRDRVFVGRAVAAPAAGLHVISAVSLTTYGVDRRTVVLELTSGALSLSEIRSGHDLGTTRIAYPDDGGDRKAYAEALGALREIVGRVQAGHVWLEVGFDTGPRAELIGALCYLDALSRSVTDAR